MERGGRLSALNVNASQIIEFGREYVFSKFILKNKGFLYLGSSDVHIVVSARSGSNMFLWFVQLGEKKVRALYGLLLSEDNIYAWEIVNK